MEDEFSAEESTAGADKGDEENESGDEVQVVGIAPSDGRPRSFGRKRKTKRVSSVSSKKTQLCAKDFLDTPREAHEQVGDENLSDDEVSVVAICRPAPVDISPPPSPRRRRPESAMRFFAFMQEPSRALLVFRLLPTAADVRSTLVALGAGLRQGSAERESGISCAVAGAAYRLLCERALTREEAVALYRHRSAATTCSACACCQGRASSLCRIVGPSLFSGGLNCAAFWRGVFFERVFGRVCEVCGGKSRDGTDASVVSWSLSEGKDLCCPAAATVCRECSRRLIPRRQAQEALRRLREDEALLARCLPTLASSIRGERSGRRRDLSATSAWRREGLLVEQRLRAGSLSSSSEEALPEAETTRKQLLSEEEEHCLSDWSFLAQDLSAASRRAVRAASELGGLFLQRALLVALLQRHAALTRRLKKRVLRQTFAHWKTHFGPHFMQSHFADAIAAEERDARRLASQRPSSQGDDSLISAPTNSELPARAGLERSGERTEDRRPWLALHDLALAVSSRSADSRENASLQQEALLKRMRRATLRGRAIVAVEEDGGGSDEEEELGQRAPSTTAEGQAPSRSAGLLSQQRLRLRVVGPSRATHFALRLELQQTETSRKCRDTPPREDEAPGALRELSLKDLLAAAPPAVGGGLFSLTRILCQTLVLPLLRRVIRDAEQNQAFEEKVFCAAAEEAVAAPGTAVSTDDTRNELEPTQRETRTAAAASSAPPETASEFGGGICLEDFFCACASLQRLAYRSVIRASRAGRAAESASREGKRGPEAEGVDTCACRGFRLTRHPDFVCLNSMFEEWLRSELGLLRSWMQRLRNAIPKKASATAALCAAGAQGTAACASAAGRKKLSLLQQSKCRVQNNQKALAEKESQGGRQRRALKSACETKAGEEAPKQKDTKTGLHLQQDEASALYAAFLLECLWGFLFDSQSQTALRPVTSLAARSFVCRLYEFASEPKAGVLELSKTLLKQLHTQAENSENAPPVYVLRDSPLCWL